MKYKTNEKHLITAVLFENSELLPNKIGILKIGDSRILKPNIIQTKTNKDKDIEFVTQACSEVYYKDFKFNFFTPNNIGLLRYLYKDSLKKYRITLKNHVEKNDLGENYKDNHETKYEEMLWTSKMVFEMIQYAETAVIFSYTMIEALVNHLIPENYKYSSINSKGIEEVYDKKAIERYIALSTKIKTIMSDILKEDSTKEPFWNRFNELEKIRNVIVHHKNIDKEFFFQFFNEKTIGYIDCADEILEYCYQHHKIIASKILIDLPLYENEIGMTCPIYPMSKEEIKQLSTITGEDKEGNIIYDIINKKVENKGE